MYTQGLVCVCIHTRMYARTHTHTHTQGRVPAYASVDYLWCWHIRMPLWIRRMPLYTAYASVDYVWCWHIRIHVCTHIYTVCTVRMLDILYICMYTYTYVCIHAYRGECRRMPPWTTRGAGTSWKSGLSAPTLPSSAETTSFEKVCHIITHIITHSMSHHHSLYVTSSLGPYPAQFC